MSNSTTLNMTGVYGQQTLNTINTGGPFGAAGTIIITTSPADNEHEQLSVADIRRFKQMCELLDYIASVDPKFREYMTAFKAKQRILR